MGNCKIFSILFIFLFLSSSVALGQMGADTSMLQNVNAKQAMAIANQWKWTDKNIKTYVSPREVVFKFPDGTIKKVALPQDEMVVAIAPYLTYTHT